MTGPSLFDRIAQGGNRLFGLPKGLLSDEEQQFARQQGLLGLGSSLLRASRPSRDPVGLGQALGEAIPQGQAAAFQGIAQLQALQDREQNQKRRSQRQQIMQKHLGEGNLGVEQFQGMLRDLTAAGDVEAARPIAAVLQSMISRQGREGQGPTPRLQAGMGPEGQPGFFNIEGGQATRVEGITPISRGQAAPRLQAGVGPEGQPGFFNIEGEEVTRIEGIRPIPRAPAKPRDLRTDPRTTRMFARFIDLKGQMLKPVAVDLSTPNLQVRIDSGDFVQTDRGVFTKPPDLATINRRAMRQAREEFNPLFRAEEQSELDSITEELVREPEREPEPEDFSADEIKEAKRLVQGLSRQQQENELAAVGYTTDEIKRILNGR